MEEANKIVNIVDTTGKACGEITLPASVFSKKLNKHLLYQTVRWQRAKARAGTHCVLTRAEVSGGGKKPWKQKGTGMARAGSNTSPLFVRGGAAHGPKPKSYEFSLNKKERKKALADAIAAKIAQNTLFVVKNFKLDKINTKAAVEKIETLGLEAGQKILFVLPASEKNIYLSLRNIKNLKCIDASGVNVYDVVNAKAMIVLEEVFSNLLNKFTTQKTPIS